MAGWAAAPAALCPATCSIGPRSLPDALGASVVWALFETRLLPEAARVDVAVMLAAGTSRAAMRSALLADPDRWPPAWSESGRAVVAWMLPGHPVHEACRLSLEWDCRPDLGAPFPFVTFDHAPGVSSTRGQVAHIAAGLAEAVDGRSLAPTDHAAIAAAPPAATLLHFGCMGERSRGDRRWVIGVPPLDVGAFLHAVGWRGDIAQVAAWARNFASGAYHLSVHLDTGRGIGERVGLEWFFPGRPGVDHRWSPLFGALREHRLASESCLSGLSEWPGAGGGTTRLLDIKVAFDPNGPCEAKAYLAFTSTAADAAAAPSSAKPGA